MFSYWKYSYDLDNWMLVNPIRNDFSSLLFSTKKVEHWTTRAACQDKPSEWFQISQMDDPEVSDLTDTRDVSAYNKNKVAQAMAVCKDCPVRQECIDNSDPSDLFWSVRGGRLPTYYSEGSKSIPTFPSDNYKQYICRAGHHQGDRYRGYKTNQKTGNKVQYCIGCDNARTAARGKRKRGTMIV